MKGGVAMSENNEKNTGPNIEDLLPPLKSSGFDSGSTSANSSKSWDGGSIPPEEDFIVSFKNWLFANNPFYLLSVFFMFWGLYLASVDGATGRGPESLKSLILFYAVENLYEIIMFAMALYLLHKRVNQPHGRLLVFFIIIFLCDATMYQSVIANSCDLSTMWVGGVISSVYFILAAIKIGLLLHFLRIRIYYEAIFYSLSSFALLYFTPHMLNYMAMTKGTNQYNVWWVFYVIMLTASILQLPVILMNWNKKYEDFVDESENKYFGGTELYFYKMIVIIPFIAVPVQIFLNAASDLKSINPDFANFDYGFIPYIFFSAFFIQSVYKSLISSYFGSLNMYDFICSLVIFAVAVITKPTDISVFGAAVFYPHRINVLLMIAANIAFFITRKNYMSISFVAALALYYTKTYYIGVVEYFTANTTRRAVLFIMVSFVMLAAGFVLSIAGKNAGNGPAITERVKNEEASAHKNV